MQHCLQIYDEIYGDPIDDIAPGVTFAKLADSCEYSTYDTAKKDFVTNEKPSALTV